MKVLLVDADSVIPNVALMKLSTFYKERGDVDLLQLHLPYYPRQRKTPVYIDTEGYTEAFCSVIFPANKDRVVGDIEFGGTGFSLHKTLPDKIEESACDYSIYPTDTSYGFLTRGCIRKCKFCFVPEKEGYIRQVAEIDDVVHHRKVKFLDNNILAFEKHKRLLSELVERKIWCQFKAGLDIRLVDRENSVLLRDMQYIPEYMFAFDNLDEQYNIEKKLDLLEWRKPWEFKFFLYVDKNTEETDIIYRLNWCRKHKVLPYVMRNIDVWYTPKEKFFTAISAYANQPNIFKCLDFDVFMSKWIKNKERIDQHINLYRKSGG